MPQRFMPPGGRWIRAQLDHTERRAHPHLPWGQQIRHRLRQARTPLLAIGAFFSGMAAIWLIQLALTSDQLGSPRRPSSQGRLASPELTSPDGVRPATPAPKSSRFRPLPEASDRLAPAAPPLEATPQAPPAIDEAPPAIDKAPPAEAGPMAPPVTDFTPAAPDTAAPAETPPAAHEIAPPPTAPAPKTPAVVSPGSPPSRNQQPPSSPAPSAPASLPPIPEPPQPAPAPEMTAPRAPTVPRATKRPPVRNIDKPASRAAKKPHEHLQREKTQPRPAKPVEGREKARSGAATPHPAAKVRHAPIVKATRPARHKFVLPPALSPTVTAPQKPAV